jgi:hypothetical protein
MVMIEPTRLRTYLGEFLGLNLDWSEEIIQFLYKFNT